MSQKYVLYKKTSILTSGKEVVFEYDIFIIKLSKFNQYACIKCSKNFFEIVLYPDPSTPVCNVVTSFPKF